MLKIPLLVSLGHHGGREKSCVFAATVLDPSDTQRQTRTGRPFSVLYRTRPAAFCPYPGGLKFGQMGSASPTYRSWLPLWRWLPLLLLFISTR